MNYNQIKKNITESILHKHRGINEEIGIYSWNPPNPVGGFRPESWGAYPSHFWLFIPGQGYQLMIRQEDGQFVPHPRPPLDSPPNGNVYPIYFPNGTTPPKYPSPFYLKPNSGPRYGPGVPQSNPPEHVNPNLYTQEPGVNSTIPSQQGQGYPWNPNWWRDPTYNLPYYFPGPGIIPTPITPDQQLVDPSDNFDVEVHNDWWTNPHWRLPPEFLEDSESGGSGSEDSGSGTNNPL